MVRTMNVIVRFSVMLFGRMTSKPLRQKRRPQERPMDLATVRDKIHPEDWGGVFRALEEALSGGARYNVECRVYRPKGEVRIIDSRGDVKRDTSGRPTLMFGTVQDITDRKRAEHERERLRQLEADLAHVNRVSTLGEMSAFPGTRNPAAHRGCHHQRQQLH